MTLDFFSQICKIPHASGNTQQLQTWLVEQLKLSGALVKQDEFGNIYAVKGAPKICLQAHFDMVKVGGNPQVEVQLVKKQDAEFELLAQSGWQELLGELRAGANGGFAGDEGLFLRAKDSSLGADNGVGVAMILSAFARRKNLEALITNDEEVGLVGAEGFCGEFLSPNLLNLDSEDEGEIVIGCAADVKIKFDFDCEWEEAVGGEFWQFSAKCSGGHSGIDIDKNIPNAVSVLAKLIHSNGGRLALLKGGERINSIPAAASAIAHFKQGGAREWLEGLPQGVTAHKIQASFPVESGKILSFLAGFKSGVYEKDENGVKTSANLSLADFSGARCEVSVFARSSDERALKRLCREFECEFKGCVELGQISLAWKPKRNEFSALVAQKFAQNRLFATTKAIHAGLECGVLVANFTKKFAKPLNAVSIGPNITSPHSTNEALELSSLRRIERVLEAVLDEFDA